MKTWKKLALMVALGSLAAMTAEATHPTTSALGSPISSMPT